MYLMKMRTGNANEDIGRLFHVTRVTVERQLPKVRSAMMKDFAPEYVNYIRNREELIQMNTKMGQYLLCGDNPNRAIIVCDGTYVYIDKSRNYEFQKKSYNDQKKRNFLKIMMCVALDGTILYVFGPDAAVDNDAKILKRIQETTDAFDSFENGDIMLLDRGFRDCVQHFKERGFDVRMPELVQRSESKKQLTTAQANRSRLVTALRFIVEMKNGHIKNVWSYFDQRLGTFSVKTLSDDVQICAALLNCYFRKIESNKGVEEEISQRMLARVDKENELAKIVTKHDFQKHMKTFEMFNDFESLPYLTKWELMCVSLGKYQIKEAESYCQEHMRDDQSFNVFALPAGKTQALFSSYYEADREPVLLYASFKSRFKSQTKHRTFCLVNANGDGETAVIGYCCDCYCGLRTVGCCSHIMCLIWFTLHIKNRDIPKPASFLNNILEENLLTFDT